MLFVEGTVLRSHPMAFDEHAKFKHLRFCYCIAFLIGGTCATQRSRLVSKFSNSEIRLPMRLSIFPALASCANLV